MNPWIGIALGDPTGIGPEVTLKALAAELASNRARYLIIGDATVWEAQQRLLGLKLPWQPFHDYHTAGPVALWNPLPTALPQALAPGAPEAARAAMAWLTDGAQRCLRGELRALVTAPVNKEAIIRAGHSFTGQTEYLAQLAQTRRFAMMLLGADDRERWLRVALVTTHVPLKTVAELISTEKIESVIALTTEACRQLGLAQARIGVCGLNPHAGEGGQLGIEEQEIIAPAVRAAQARNYNVIGPLPADTLFYQAYRGEFDAVVAMYHDQGLAPLKMIGFDRGVNWTLGLPFIRTSPDHGTAYDIVGKNRAQAASMQSALRLARQLAGL